MRSWLNNQQWKKAPEIYFYSAMARSLRSSDIWKAESLIKGIPVRNTQRDPVLLRTI
jgi:hypothetical protein